MYLFKGTFKTISRHWKQLFIFTVEYRGLFVPVCFGWLPDKKPISYYVFMYLTAIAFREVRDEILEFYGRNSFRLRKLRCDFEYSIHQGLDCFVLSGCFFHFSQALWRKVMTSGLYLAYVQNREFKTFIRMATALAFLPLNRIGKNSSPGFIFK